MTTPDCPTCQGSGTHIEHHGMGMVEMLACLDCEGTGHTPPTAYIVVEADYDHWEILSVHHTEAGAEQARKQYEETGIIHHIGIHPWVITP